MPQKTAKMKSSQSLQLPAIDPSVIRGGALSPGQLPAEATRCSREGLQVANLPSGDFSGEREHSQFGSRSMLCRRGRRRPQIIQDHGEYVFDDWLEQDQQDGRE